MRTLVLSFVLCSLVAGCAATRPSQSYQVLKPQGESIIVIAVKRLRVQDAPADPLPVMAAGAVAGSLLGPKIAALQTKVTLGTGPTAVVGAVAGAFAAELAAPYLFSVDGFEIVARRSNGEKIAIIQPGNGWSPMIGQVAYLVSTEAGPRIVPD